MNTSARSPRTTPPRRRGILAAATALAVGGLAAAPAAAAPAAPDTITAVAVDMADPDATAETRSLFAYLRDLGTDSTLFGHQEDLYFGESFDTQDGWSSDVLTATGDHPAVIGFDTLETAGMPLAEREAKALTLADNIRQAHDVGAISTMTVHLENLVTGGDFYDTTGDALRAVLPGGTHHDGLRAYLDRFATTAHHAVDADGNPIPIVFRPWHENAGSWFWWGASFGTPGEYAELFRFTVEYLRDVKGVHNLLYAFSPGGGFGGDRETYLRTYPGDDFVDVLGYDTYDDSGASPGFLGSLVADLAMMGDLAEERGKISALTEFGISGGVRPDGENANTTWYTDVLAAIMSDPSAARTAYLLTWANYGGDTTPYTPVEGELLPDFQAFAADPATLFADDVAGAYDVATSAVPSATAHLASPADGARVATGPVELRASVTGYDADRVTVTTDAGPADDATEVELAPPGDGELWWTGSWDVPDAALDNSARTITLHVWSGGAEVDTHVSSVVLGPEPEQAPGVVDDFEAYGDDTALRRQWVPQNVNRTTLVRAAAGAVGGGDAAMRVAYSFASQSYTGVGRRITGDWSSFRDFEAWIDPDASGNTLVLQLVAGGVAFEAYPSLAGDDPYLATIPFADWRPAPWDTANADRRLDPETLAAVTQFSVFVNAADGGATEGAVVVDELRAVEGAEPRPTYADVGRDHPDHDAVEWLHDAVIDLADGGDRFLPRRPVTHRELTAVLGAYAPDARVRVPGPASSAVDRGTVAGALWAVAGSPEPAREAAFGDARGADPAALAWVTEHEVIDPRSETRFGTVLSVTRAELARWLHRLDALPAPRPPATLVDFGGGTGGWRGAGTLTAAGGHLVAERDAAGWIGGTGGWDLSDRSALLVDVAATIGTELRVALQVGPGWSWCEAAAGTADGPRTGDDAVVVDLSALSAECRDQLADVRGVNLHLDAGRHEIAAVRAR
jgi:mannan endo-1,4-beta-mannosidase